ncbi:hypothetical protein Tco_0316891 [Tanacetum coccineum]
MQSLYPPSQEAVQLQFKFARRQGQESEEKTAAVYITVLSQSIQDELKLLPIWTIDQSHNLAMKVERSMSKQALNFEETLEGKLNSIDVNQFNQTQLTIKTNISSSLTTLVLASKSGVKKQVITKKMDSNPYSKIVPPECFKCSLPCHRFGKNIAILLNGRPPDLKSLFVCLLVEDGENSRASSFQVRRNDKT